MKKLTNLQILIAMGLVGGSTEIFCRAEQLIQPGSFVQASIEAEADEDLNDAVVAELRKSKKGQQTLKNIILDESDLENTFESIRTCVHHKNEEIAGLLKSKKADQLAVARIAVELADVQVAIDKATERARAKGKKKHKIEDVIAAEYKKATVALKDLNDQIARGFNAAVKSVSKQVKNLTGKKSKSSKAVVKASAVAKPVVDDADSDGVSDNAELAVEYVQSQLFPAEEDEFVIVDDVEVQGLPTNE